MQTWRSPCLQSASEHSLYHPSCKRRTGPQLSHCSPTAPKNRVLNEALAAVDTKQTNNVFRENYTAQHYPFHSALVSNIVTVECKSLGTPDSVPVNIKERWRWANTQKARRSWSYIFFNILMNIVEEGGTESGRAAVPREREANSERVGERFTFTTVYICWNQNAQHSEF